MDIMFTIIPILIAIGALLIFGMFVFTFVGFFRHRNTIRDITTTVMQRHAEQHAADRRQNHAEDTSSGQYRCDHCGAAIGDNTDISPSGDFRCQYCNNWSNVT